MRLFKNILCLVLLLAMMAVPAWTEAPSPEDGDCSALLYQEGSFVTQEVTYSSNAINKVDTAKRILLEGLRNGDEYIDFSGSGVYYERDIKPAFHVVVNENPDLFYVSGGYAPTEYTYDRSLADWVVIKLKPTYNMEISQIAAARQRFAAELSRIVDYASAGSTPLMKALLVNDYFCINYQYDLTHSINDAYNLFTKKTGVCNAYMLGYKAALNELGIPVKTAVSEAMNHGWNLVQIDGYWYHVDVTWDDPTPDRFGRAEHCYFMRSDSGLLNNSYGGAHHSWVAEDDTKAASTRFDNAVWCMINSPMPVRGDTFYLIRGNTNGEIVAVTGDRHKTVHTFSTKWVVTEPDNYGAFYGSSCFSVLSAYKDYLLYTTYDAVYAVSLKDGSVQTLYNAPSEMGIWEAVFDGNVLHYGLGQDYYAVMKYGDYALNLDGVGPVGALLVLPEKTVVVRAEAFYGSKVRNVVSSKSLQRIESLAFANCTSLETVQLGANVKFIADDAFRGCKDVTFFCPKGSYAESYAKAHGFAVEFE